MVYMESNLKDAPCEAGLMLRIWQAHVSQSTASIWLQNQAKKRKKILDFCFILEADTNFFWVIIVDYIGRITLLKKKPVFCWVFFYVALVWKCLWAEEKMLQSDRAGLKKKQREANAMFLTRKICLFFQNLFKNITSFLENNICVKNVLSMNGLRSVSF